MATVWMSSQKRYKARWAMCHPSPHPAFLRHLPEYSSSGKSRYRHGTVSDTVVGVVELAGRAKEQTHFNPQREARSSAAGD